VAVGVLIELSTSKSRATRRRPAARPPPRNPSGLAESASQCRPSQQQRLATHRRSHRCSRPHRPKPPRHPTPMDRNDEALIATVRPDPRRADLGPLVSWSKPDAIPQNYCVSRRPTADGRATHTVGEERPPVAAEDEESVSLTLPGRDGSVGSSQRRERRVHRRRLTSLLRLVTLGVEPMRRRAG
jgi:hypothetical protein